MRIDAVDHDLARTLINRICEEFGATVTLVKAHLGETRQVHQAQHDDDRANDRRHAEDLFAFDP